MSKLYDRIPPLLEEGAMQLHRLRTALEQLHSHLKPTTKVSLGIQCSLYKMFEHQPVVAITSSASHPLMEENGTTVLRPVALMQYRNHFNVFFFLHVKLFVGNRIIMHA
jgi:hypothetical protein